MQIELKITSLCLYLAWKHFIADSEQLLLYRGSSESKWNGWDSLFAREKLFIVHADMIASC